MRFIFFPLLCQKYTNTAIKEHILVLPTKVVPLPGGGSYRRHPDSCEHTFSVGQVLIQHPHHNPQLLSHHPSITRRPQYHRWRGRGAGGSTPTPRSSPEAAAAKPATHILSTLARRLFRLYLEIVPPDVQQG